ncbi:hypothetical protein P879_01130 [Paragonimus westermani]|uniref:14-3-3 domain-containing protein n=1 Tax=Paragonimus westermani TaxID=34504 RepID=A0A8T0DWI6_9TREM|nr:hypothetical protein P879_01130 [Paragonimus westermani]
MSQDRDSKVLLAKIAEQAERYDVNTEDVPVYNSSSFHYDPISCALTLEMQKAMTEVAQMPGELSTEERNLLSVAYKNVIGARRSSWRILSSIEQKDGDENAPASQAQKMLQRVVEKELDEICNKILDLLDKHLIPSSETYESKVFFYKMKGDYKRYLAEIAVGEKRSKASEDSLVAYKAASDIANEHLPTTNPVRLGLALNFSVFYYEILNNPQRACELAKEAFAKATQDLEEMREGSIKDSTLILQLLRDNLTLWDSDVQGEEEADAAQKAAAH